MARTGLADTQRDWKRGKCRKNRKNTRRPKPSLPTRTHEATIWALALLGVLMFFPDKDMSAYMGMPIIDSMVHMGSLRFTRTHNAAKCRGGATVPQAHHGPHIGPCL